MNQISAYNTVHLQHADNILIQEHATLVKRIAHHLMTRLPASVQLDDLLQAGMIGLLDAAKNYNASKGASFTTYAAIRVRGTMLDEVRKNDWVPRSVHRNSRRVAAAMRQIENQTGRDARDFEVAALLDISLEDYHKILRDSNNCRLLGLEDIGAGESSYEDMLKSDLPGPLERLQTDDFHDALSKFIDNLPERERMVLTLYYDDELNLKEIGVILHVSESRVCQIHGQAMLRLRSRVRAM